VLAAAGDEPVQALHAFGVGGGEFKRVVYDETPSNRARFESTVSAIVDGMRSGAFPAESGSEDDFYNTFDNCRLCAFHRLCARRRVYEFDAKQSDPSMQSWHRVSATARGESQA
jgi:hypothetical protein